MSAQHAPGPQQAGAKAAYVRCEKHHGESGVGAIVPTCAGCKASALSSGITEEQWAAYCERVAKATGSAS